MQYTSFAKSRNPFSEFCFKGIERFRILHFLCQNVQKQPPEVFLKNSVLRNSAKFTGKHLCQRLFLIKLQALGTFLTEQPRTTASYCLKFLEIKRSWFGSISYWVYCLGRYYLVNCNCNLVLQKLHSVYAMKTLAKIWMFELQDFKYLYGILWQNYLYQENIGKIITCH